MAVLPYYADDAKSSSLIVPLVRHHIEDGIINYKTNDKANNQLDEEGTTTFFKTCFNGLNALSGFSLLYSHC